MRNAIWDSMLDADLNERYWSKLCRRYYAREKWAKIFLALMASGTVATWKFWGEYELIWKILSSSSALLAIALPIFNWPKMIENMVYLSEKWCLLKNDYELLWIEVKKGVPNEIKCSKEFKKIKTKESVLSQKEANLPEDKKLLSKCFQEVKCSRGLY